ncbi:aminoacyl tRNA synthase complex-interacting multifunctional protein 1 [Ischnura elegans]|uniref:aminoacyl tRNA synthase complex-interacting multifunctional protein 1 n=1 Tax=Ischnura elegans TaxID=197161 RepID=UPI001ED8B042|nr:aminoacyl tRNA synthase complex-interacting multifunctional protein 1 [Ischnura elegans]
MVTGGNLLIYARLAFNLFYKMNPNEVMRRLESRAIEAQKLITSLKSEIADLKRASHGANADKECKDLMAENECLEKEIEVWKKKLIEAETKNGKKSVLVHLAATSSTTTKPVANGLAAEPKPKVEKTRATPQETKPPASSKEGATDQEKSKRKSADKKPKQDVKKDNAAEKSDDLVDVGRLDIRIGRIVEVKKHPDADSLYVESVELGEEKQRTVVSGLVRFIQREELEGRLVALLCNLKPAKMRGVTSEAMVLCASTPEKVEVLNPPPGSSPGDIVVCEGFTHRPDPVLNPKKKVWETVAADLKVNSLGIATYKGVPLTVSGKGEVRSTGLTDVPIK